MVCTIFTGKIVPAEPDSALPLTKCLNDESAAAVNYCFYHKIIRKCLGISALCTFIFLLCLIQANGSRINYYNKYFYDSAFAPVKDGFALQFKIVAAEKQLQEFDEYQLFTPDDLIQDQRPSILATLKELNQTCNQTQQLNQNELSKRIDELNQSQENLYIQTICPFIAAMFLVFAIIMFCFCKQQKFVVSESESDHSKFFSYCVLGLTLSTIMDCLNIFMQYGIYRISVKDVPILCGTGFDSSSKFLTEGCYNGAESCYSIWNPDAMAIFNNVLFVDIFRLLIHFITFVGFYKCPEF